MRREAPRGVPRERCATLVAPRGLYVDAATWDGRAPFAPARLEGRGKEAAHTFALGAAACALRNAKAGNISLGSALEYATDASWVRPEDGIAVSAPEA
jgi:hypothetical protein